MGWDLVPPTVPRAEAPLGPGSLQLFVAHDPGQHYFTLLERHADAFRRLALLDAVCNNADRKSGHCLLDPGGAIRAIDNGLTFHVEPKLRTVIWDFAGEPIPEADRTAVAGLATALEAGGAGRSRLRRLISAAELRTLLARARRWSEPGVFPEPESSWSFPWPLI